MGRAGEAPRGAPGEAPPSGPKVGDGAAGTGAPPLLRPPRLRRGGAPGGRHAIWLELFFDLVFVIAVAELARDLAADLTTKDDVAAFAARAALDDAAPRVLRVAGDTVTVRQMAATLTEPEGRPWRPWRPLRAGGLSGLGAMIRVAKLVAPGCEDPFPPWQGMAYMRDLFPGEGRLKPLDDRDPGLAFTSVRDHLAWRWGRDAGASRAAA